MKDLIKEIDKELTKNRKCCINCINCIVMNSILTECKKIGDESLLTDLLTKNTKIKGEDCEDFERSI